MRKLVLILFLLCSGCAYPMFMSGTFSGWRSEMVKINKCPNCNRPLGDCIYEMTDESDPFHITDIYFCPRCNERFNDKNIIWYKKYTANPKR